MKVSKKSFRPSHTNTYTGYVDPYEDDNVI
jgi:hypothetical protein